MLIENQVEVRSRTTPPAVVDDLVTELGIWLSGIESFIASHHYSFGDSTDGSPLDSSKEFQIVHSTLQRCVMLNARLLSGHGAGADAALIGYVKYRDLRDLASLLREATLLSEALIHSSSLGAGEWKAWCGMLSHRFSALPAFAGIIRLAEIDGEDCLPAALRNPGGSSPALTADHAELALVLPRFAKVLKWLDIVGRMLEADEPLKPALLIFSRVNEQIFELTTYINSRLARFPNEEVELFASLDAASYTASIELKKVYSQELAGLAHTRPAPSIYARIETAHSLLSDGFQQILAGLARLIDPSADIFDLFPNFQIKRERSLILRDELWEVVRVVQNAEKNPEKKHIETLQKTLREFMKGTVRYLFYKDTETVERFVEEILVTKENKDLVPILHRFGAYLEALSGQVNLRAVLEKHPFQGS